MKISMFHLMPHRELPDDFEQRYKSVWVDPPWHELADPVRVGQYYNWTLDELIYAAQAGLDGICVNEHHQNAYGFMPGPNLMGSVLARATNGLDVAIVQMGSTLPTTNPPIRVAEEYAMLDCISGGRLVAGMPLGSPMDANMVYGIPPIEQRERYYEAHDLIIKAWTSRGDVRLERQVPEAGDGQPLAPSRPDSPTRRCGSPGTGSLSTWDFAAKHDHCYCFLSYFGNQLGKRVMDGFWEFVDQPSLDPNPYRAGFLQLVAVGGDRRPGREGVRRAHQVLLRQVPAHPAAVPRPARPPGLPEPRARHPLGHRGPHGGDARPACKDMTFKDFIDDQFVICGSPATVRDQLQGAIENLRVGNLMVLLHIGSMPHELTLKNIDLFAARCSRTSATTGREWENHWWPQSLRHQRQLTGTVR